MRSPLDFSLMRRGLGKAAVFWLTMGMAALVSAEGFRNPPAGSFGLGRAGARRTQIEEASAVVHNPANLVYLKQAEVSLSVGGVFIEAEYDGPGGEGETREPWKVLPSLFLAAPLEGGRAAVGLGVSTPYGISQEWEMKGVMANPDPATGWRYQSPYFAEMKTINVTPVVALRLSDELTLGLGFEAMWSELTLEQMYPWSAFLIGAGVPPAMALLAPEGVIKSKGDGAGFGAHGGLTWQFSERQRVALTARAPMEVNYRGDFTASNVPAGVGAAGVTSKSEFRTEIQFPTILGLGYGIQVSETVRLGIDVEWLQFSNFDSLPLNIGNNQVLLGGRTEVPQKWNDTFTAGIGGDWQFHPDWVLRSGYQFYESPVPEETFSPTIPDANQHAFTAGLGYVRDRHSFEVAYGGILYDDREIEGNLVGAFNGEYRTVVHLFAASYSFRF